MKIEKLAITERPVDELIPYVNNARIHSDEQVAQIAASIKEFGFNVPIVTDGENGVLAGHGRLLAARKLGLATVPVIEAGHLSKAQRKAFILADNKIGDNSSFDFGIINLEMQELRESDFDLALTGFSDFEIETITAGGSDIINDGLRAESDHSGDFEGDGGEYSSRMFLSFGTVSVQITEREMALLQERYDRHVEETGTEFGFAMALAGD